MLTRNARVLLAAAAACSLGVGAIAQDDQATGLAHLGEEAEALRPMVETDLARRFLDVADDLTPVEPREIYFRRADRSAMTPAEFEAAPEDERTGYEPMTVDWRQYYGLYSSPLAWTRPLDVVAQTGFESADGKRIMDFGFGNVGQLRMLASMGADVVGVEIPGIQEAIYSRPEDAGAVGRAPEVPPGEPGSVALAFGRWPGGEGMRDAVGGGFDLIMSKNVLKLGYIHPEQEVDARMLVDLGVDDEAFVEALWESLAPGGFVLIYNIYPPQPEDRYIPWGHGENPFARSLWESVGFEVVAWNEPDSAGVHAMGRALGWDAQDPESFEASFLGMYTMLRRPAE